MDLLSQLSIQVGTLRAPLKGEGRVPLKGI